MTLEEAGACFAAGGAVMGIFASLLIIRSWRNTWCKYCKLRHNPKHFTPERGN